MRTMTGTRVSSRTTSPSCAPRGDGAKRVGARAAAMLVGMSALIAFAPEARADEISPKGKGITGGALLGGEVVVITESLVGVKQGWAHLLGAGIGAAGGGVAGYFIEQSSTDAHVPVFMLAGGISLLIPALVLSLNATRYQERAESSEDNAPTGPAPDPGAVGGSVVIGGSGGAKPSTPPTPPSGSGGPPSTESPKPGSGGGALLDLGGGDVRVGVPVPQVRPMYSLQQLKDLGVPQQTEYRLPVVHVTF